MYNYFKGVSKIRYRHGRHNFRQADFLHICHCVVHNLKTLVISKDICKIAKVLILSETVEIGVCHSYAGGKAQGYVSF